MTLHPSPSILPWDQGTKAKAVMIDGKWTSVEATAERKGAGVAETFKPFPSKRDLVRVARQHNWQGVDNKRWARHAQYNGMPIIASMHREKAAKQFQLAKDYLEEARYGR